MLTKCIILLYKVFYILCKCETSEYNKAYSTYIMYYPPTSLGLS